VTEAAQGAPAPPANATEAAARLETFKTDSAQREKLLAGDIALTKEWHDLHGLIASADDRVSSAMAGQLSEIPDSDHRLMANTATMLRELGLNEGTVQQTLENRPVTQQEFDTVAALKAQKFRDQEWTKSLLNGDAQAGKELILINIVLSSPIEKKEKA
jgi:RecA-family ATPase